ncbi:hypothetical protein ACFQ36_11165 [Arthrobacter sp. GCM10027362]|uniref:hypothetical protein n=1 Tax=Arthrobacter sp. GCM10027362 TaxID=3273379 RepID=UPI00362C5B60
MDRHVLTALGLVAIAVVVVLFVTAAAADRANREKEERRSRSEPSWAEKLDRAASEQRTARRAGSPRSTNDSAAYWAPVVGGTAFSNSGTSSSCASGGGCD